MSGFTNTDLILVGTALAALVWCLAVCILALITTQRRLRGSLASLTDAFAASLEQHGRRLKEKARP